MTKPNKADYTKEQWRKLKEKIKLEKAAKRAAKANKIPPRIPIKNLDNNITSFVLGNGLSRTLVDLNAIKEYGKVYGCNALYREWDGYDYLVAIDQRMEDEIKNNKK